MKRLVYKAPNSVRETTTTLTYQLIQQHIVTRLMAAVQYLPVQVK